MNVNQINVKIDELRKEQRTVGPGATNVNMTRYFEIDAEINELADKKYWMMHKKSVPTQAQLDRMDYVLSDAYDDD